MIFPKFLKHEAKDSDRKYYCMNRRQKRPPWRWGLEYTDCIPGGGLSPAKKECPEKDTWWWGSTSGVYGELLHSKRLLHCFYSQIYVDPDWYDQSAGCVCCRIDWLYFCRETRLFLTSVLIWHKVIWWWGFSNAEALENGGTLLLLSLPGPTGSEW